MDKSKILSSSNELINSLSNNKLLGLPKLKTFADNKMYVTKILKIGIRRVENIVGKGENTGYQHFLLYQKCFQKASFTRLFNPFPHSHTTTLFDAQHCGKRRNCSWWAISPFPKVFSTCLDNSLSFSSNLKLSSANSLSLEESKICRLVMG